MRPIYTLPFGREKTEDMAGLSRGKREWATMEAGLIKSWDDFEQYPWLARLTGINLWHNRGMSEE